MACKDCYCRMFFQIFHLVISQNSIYAVKCIKFRFTIKNLLKRFFNTVTCKSNTLNLKKRKLYINLKELYTVSKHLKG